MITVILGIFCCESRPFLQEGRLGASMLTALKCELNWTYHAPAAQRRRLAELVAVLELSTDLGWAPLSNSLLFVYISSLAQAKTI